MKHDDCGTCIDIRFSGNGSAGAFAFGYFIFLLLNQMHGPKLNLTRLQK